MLMKPFTLPDCIHFVPLTVYPMRRLRGFMQGFVRRSVMAFAMKEPASTGIGNRTAARVNRRTISVYTVSAVTWIGPVPYAAAPLPRFVSVSGEHIFARLARLQNPAILIGKAG